ncbi:hypothetical protein WR25_27157 isoform B [Diploscapter pachys]|uniref:Protein kinase domain-containing protein n=1 Tax=Diploscapter pachys TaxID=2018661 RepID=A0A2A2LWH6_9BILA|nr:hypothetical protein WR25_27157 isoform A [Diploscapter pachys]PAV90508.1 hypothetical protein WR25_27157 isoform B [Diploscapter pachys]
MMVDRFRILQDRQIKSEPPTYASIQPREDGFSRTFSAQSLPVKKVTNFEDICNMTPYDRALHMLACDSEYQKEVNLGKRIGFYKLGKELGAGNFSKCVETLSKVHLVLEYASGGELYNYVHERGKLTEAEAQPLFAQIVSAVSHMHARSIVHRDIKSENIMFSAPGVVKLVDFGFSCLIASSSQQLETFCGSPPYAAPELFRDSSYSGALVDVWALGVLLYFMLVGVTPFRGETVAELKAIIMQGEYVLPDYLSTFATHLITSILEINITKRLRVEEIKVWIGINSSRIFKVCKIFSSKVPFFL